MTDEHGTWHHGLIARWWAEFNEPDPDELARYRRAIEHGGGPALDLACGAGRLLLPLLEAGLDVEGADVSADMLAWCRSLAARRGLEPTLHRQPMHGLDLGRRYRTIYICDSFGLGGDRANDVEALRRVHRHLEPGGTLLFSQYLPYEGKSEAEWARWLPAGRVGLPMPWPESGERRRTADGDEIELFGRLVEFDPLLQRQTMQMRARRWRDGVAVEHEEHELIENLYFAAELRLMLEIAGFTSVEVERAYSGEPATADDGMVLFVAST